MSVRGSWNDLRARMASGLAMIAVGLLGIWLGGLWFHALVAFIVAMMVWELVRMVAPASRLPVVLAIVSGAALLVSGQVAPGLALPLLLAPALIGFGQLRQGRTIFMAFTVLLLLAGFGMIALRDDYGFVWMFWLVLVVVVTDVAGYFAGRLLGGPKFWPRVSPKKTWSGTVAGWIAAAFVGVIYWLFLDGPGASNVIGISVGVAMASQMGDIAESAIKRRAGVKDSSALIPGHGGLLDRFDGMLGGSILLLIVGQIIAFPPGL